LIDLRKFDQQGVVSVGEEESDKKIRKLKVKSKKAIKNLLNIAYEALKEPEYIGYPTSDFIACFFDTKTALRSEFQNIFDDAIPDYRGRWEQFRKDKVEPMLDKILDKLTNLKCGRRSNFDYWSKEHKLIANYAVASSLFTLFYYIRINKSWMDPTRKQKLEKCIQDLINNRVPKKGWQYFHSGKEKFSGILPTWLSILALDYIPTEIVEEMTLNTKIKTIKTEVGEWLINNMHRDDENRYCAWGFQPEQSKEYNPTATAQAIATLRILKMEDKEILDYAIRYVKDNVDIISATTEKKIELEKRIQQRLVAGISTSGTDIFFPHPGIQQCLQVLLTSGVSSKDDTILNLLEKNLEKTDELLSHKQKLVEAEKSGEKKAIEEAKKSVHDDAYDIYPVLLPFLYYLYPPTKGLLLNFATSVSEFKNFVAGAGSIVIVGEIGDAYAKLIPKDARVSVYCRKPQEETLLERRGWHYEWIRIDKTYVSENINCVIVDGKKALLSNDPFKDMGDIISTDTRKAVKYWI